MGSGPAAGAEPGSRQGEWGAVRSWAHLGSRPHLLVQAVPVQRVRGPRENCRTEAGLSRAGRTPRPRGAQPQSPASPTAPHGPGFCSLTAAPRPPPHPEAAEGSRPVHGPAVSQQLRDGTSSLSQPRGLPLVRPRLRQTWSASWSHSALPVLEASPSPMHLMPSPSGGSEQERPPPFPPSRRIPLFTPWGAAQPRCSWPPTGAGVVVGRTALSVCPSSRPWGQRSELDLGANREPQCAAPAPASPALFQDRDTAAQP